MGGTWSHVAYADESNWNVGRWRSVAVASVPVAQHDRVVELCARLLEESHVAELGWKNLTSARHRFAAIKVVDAVIEEACAGRMRVDILGWDMEDSRHKDVFRRDDAANLGRMYHHLFVSILRRRWPDGSTWSLHPDEQSEVDWATLERTIDAKGSELVPDGSAIDPLRNLVSEFRLVQLVPRESSGHPLIQVADLFAGLMPYSYARYDLYAQWAPALGDQLTLDGTASLPALTGSEQERFAVLHHLKEECRRRKLYVSLRTNRGLRTIKPGMPVNFWPYEAQSEQDRAPTKPSLW